MSTPSQPNPAPWDGTLPTTFMEDLPRFWGHRNAGGRVTVAVPGLANVLYVEYLPNALMSRYQLEGPALEAARQQVMAQIRADIAPMPRERLGPWWARPRMVG